MIKLAVYILVAIFYIAAGCPYFEYIARAVIVIGFVAIVLLVIMPRDVTGGDLTSLAVSNDNNPFGILQIDITEFIGPCAKEIQDFATLIGGADAYAEERSELYVAISELFKCIAGDEFRKTAELLKLDVVPDVYTAGAEKARNDIVKGLDKLRERIAEKNKRDNNFFTRTFTTTDTERLTENIPRLTTFIRSKLYRIRERVTQKMVDDKFPTLTIDDNRVDSIVNQLMIAYDKYVDGLNPDNYFLRLGALANDDNLRTAFREDLEELLKAAAKDYHPFARAGALGEIFDNYSRLERPVARSQFLPRTRDNWPEYSACNTVFEEKCGWKIFLNNVDDMFLNHLYTRMKKLYLEKIKASLEVQN